MLTQQKTWKKLKIRQNHRNYAKNKIFADKAPLLVNETTSVLIEKPLILNESLKRLRLKTKLLYF